MVHTGADDRHCRNGHRGDLRHRGHADPRGGARLRDRHQAQPGDGRGAADQLRDAPRPGARRPRRAGRRGHPGHGRAPDGDRGRAGSVAGRAADRPFPPVQGPGVRHPQRLLVGGPAALRVGDRLPRLPAGRGLARLRRRTHRPLVRGPRPHHAAGQRLAAGDPAGLPAPLGDGRPDPRPGGRDPRRARGDHRAAVGPPGHGVRNQDEIRRLAEAANATLDRLDGALARQRSFTSDASHDLRSPIAAARTQIEEALLFPDDVDWPRTARGVLQSLERLQAIVTDLLQLARLDAAAWKDVETVDLGAMVTIEVARSDRTKRIVPHLQEGVTVRGDRLRLVRLFTNLLDNAERHAETRVDVTVRRTDGQAVLEVLDDGAGVAEEQRDLVFQRFARLEASKARDPGGTGLGLPIAREIARLHGGSLTIEDSMRGARFVLRLPRNPRTVPTTTPDRPHWGWTRKTPRHRCARGRRGCVGPARGRAGGGRVTRVRWRIVRAGRAGGSSLRCPFPSPCRRSARIRRRSRSRGCGR